MHLNRTKKRKARTHGKTNNSRTNVRNTKNSGNTNPSDTEYFTAKGESDEDEDEDEDSFTAKIQNNSRNNSSKNRHNTLLEPPKPKGKFTATVNVLDVLLPLPEKCTVFVTDIGHVPVELHRSKLHDIIDHGDLKRLDKGRIKDLGISRNFINGQFTFGPYQETKFVLKVSNQFGEYVGYVVGVFSYSLYDIPPIHYLSSEDLHRNKRGRKNAETSKPAGIRKINAGDPYVELTLVGLDKDSAEKSGFTGYHLLAICIGLVNDYHLPPLDYYRRLPDLNTLIKVPRPLNGFAYPFHASSVPWALGFYKRNGFLESLPIGERRIRGDIVKVYRNEFTGGETNSIHGVFVTLPA